MWRVRPSGKIDWNHQNRQPSTGSLSCCFTVIVSLWKKKHFIDMLDTFNQTSGHLQSVIYRRVCGNRTRILLTTCWDIYSHVCGPDLRSVPNPTGTLAVFRVYNKNTWATERTAVVCHVCRSLFNLQNNMKEHVDPSGSGCYLVSVSRCSEETFSLGSNHTDSSVTVTGSDSTLYHSNNYIYIYIYIYI